VISRDGDDDHDGLLLRFLRLRELLLPLPRLVSCLFAMHRYQLSEHGAGNESLRTGYTGVFWGKPFFRGDDFEEK
jgi:hypothetical protein